MFAIQHVTSVETWDRRRPWWLLVIALLQIVFAAGLLVAVDDPHVEARRRARELRGNVELIEDAAARRPGLISRRDLEAMRDRLERLESPSAAARTFYFMARGGTVLLTLGGLATLIAFAAIGPKYTLRIRAGGGEDERLEAAEAAWRNQAFEAVMNAVDHSNGPERRPIARSLRGLQPPPRW